MSHAPSTVRILGIDPGSLVAGFGCIDVQMGKPALAEAITMVDCGVLRFDSKVSGVNRVAAVSRAVDSLIQSLSPQVCVVEKAFVGNNVHSALRLGEVRGAIFAACGQNKIEIAEMTPTQAKKTVAGNGRASKDQVSLCLETFLDFKRGNLPSDATDALALAFSFGAEYPFREKVDKVLPKAKSKKRFAVPPISS